MAAWDQFWGSKLASLVLPEAQPALGRLFWLYDERERLAKAFRKKRFVAGSMGQPRLNPLAEQLGRLDSQILPLEDRFGLSPKAALALGIPPVTTAKSLEDLNADAALAVAEDPGEDPRDALIEHQARQAHEKNGD